MKFIYSRAFIFFSICLVVAAVVSFLEIKGVAGPLQWAFINSPRPVATAFKSVTSPVKNFFNTIYGLKKIARENVALSSQVYELQQQLADHNQLARENSTLKTELGFITTSKIKFTPCTIAAESPLELADTVIISCGQNVGISEGQGVVSKGFLIGKVVYVGKNSSTVLLITSSQFSADARLSKSGVQGIAQGSFGSGIIMDQLPQNAQSEKGDLIVTAGINSKIPANLLIGEVGSLLSSQNDLFKKLTVLSPIDFSNLEFVFVAN